MAKAISVLIGAVLILVGAGLTTAFLIHYNEGNLIHWGDMPELDYSLMMFWLESMGHSSGLFSLALVAVLVVPLLFLFYAGIRLIFGTQAKISGAFTGLALTWLGASIILGIIIGRVTHENQREMDVLFQEEILQTDSLNTAYIHLDPKYQILEDMHYENGYRLFDDEARIPIAIQDSLIYGMTEIYIRSSSDTILTVKTTSSARGNNRLKASANAENIDFSFRPNEHKLLISPYFNLTNNQEWRNNKLEVEFYLPEGHQLVFDKEILPNIIRPWIPRHRQQVNSFQNVDGRITQSSR